MSERGSGTKTERKEQIEKRKEEGRQGKRGSDRNRKGQKDR